MGCLKVTHFLKEIFLKNDKLSFFTSSCNVYNSKQISFSLTDSKCSSCNLYNIGL